MRTSGKMRTTGAIRLMAVLLLGLPAFNWAAVQRGIQGSPHDFSKAAWNISGEACNPCHQEGHNRSGPVQVMLGHATTKANFTVYDSPTFKAGRHNPNGASLACLSCHDGTVAINQL